MTLSPRVCSIQVTVLPGIPGIEPQVGQAREALGDALEDLPRPVAIRNIGGMDDHRQHQTDRIDEQMALAAVQFLGAIVAARPPFSVVLADWLSRMAALGCAWRPARCRTTSRSSSLSRSQVPSSRQARK